MMIYAEGIEGSGTGDTGQEKGTGAGILTTHVVPQCHSATLWRAGAPVQKGGEKEEVVQQGEEEEEEGRDSDLQVQGQWRRVARGTSWKCHTVRCQRAG